MALDTIIDIWLWELYYIWLWLNAFFNVSHSLSLNHFKLCFLFETSFKVMWNAEMIFWFKHREIQKLLLRDFTNLVIISCSTCCLVEPVKATWVCASFDSNLVIISCSTCCLVGPVKANGSVQVSTLISSSSAGPTRQQVLQLMMTRFDFTSSAIKSSVCGFLTKTYCLLETRSFVKKMKTFRSSNLSSD